MEEFLIGTIYVGSLLSLATVSGLIQYWELRAWLNDPNRKSGLEAEESTPVDISHQQNMLEQAGWLYPTVRKDSK